MAVVDFHSTKTGNQAHETFDHGKWMRRFAFAVIIAETAVIAFLAPPAIENLINNFLP